MGALAPIAPWIPEDDLLLKNAVEAGASLESLAKGAVLFSRRFTIRELQERWYSLLYDPDTSAEASAHMVELELAASNLSSKSNRSGNSKENECVLGKRKVESVRSHYYAMRKRICNEPCNSVDLSFLVAPGLHNCTGNGGGCQEQLTIHNEHPVGNCLLGDTISNHFEDFDIDFPQIMRSDAAAGSIGATAHAFHTTSLEDDLPDGIMGRDGLYGFAENVSPVSVNEAVGNDTGHSFEHDNVHKNIPHILAENLSAFENSSGVQEMGLPQAMSVSNLFDTGNLEVKPLSAFGTITDNPGNVCSGFGGSPGFSSPVSDCSASFHELAYSSPLPTMPIWRTIEDISTPAMPNDVNLGEKDQEAGDTLELHDDDAKKLSSTGYDAVHSQSKLKERVSSDGLTSPTAISEHDLVELSNSLLNFSNEEVLLFMDVDGKDMMDKSCLDGLLLSSPNDVHQDDIPSSSEPKASVVRDSCLVIPDVACPGELDDNGDPLHSDHGGAHEVSEISVPSSTSAPNPHSPELRDGVICCTLNTEDPEIPCNDDIFSPTQVLPQFVSSVTKHNTEEAGNLVPSIAKDFADNRKPSEQGLNLVKEEGETSAQPLVASWTKGLEVLPELRPNHPIEGLRVKSELPESDSLAVASRHGGTAGGDPSQCRSAPVTPHPVSNGTPKEENAKVDLGKHLGFDNPIDSFLERPVYGSDHINSHPQSIVGDCKQEADLSVAVQKHVSTDAELGSVEMAFPKSVVNPSTSDQEQQISENDDDVPYFSDIEAMILDMDLGPCDQDSYFSREVSRYQYEDTKKAIIRLEQGAHSYMQRAFASHRAFAILYGRHLKHYIKKSEVLLGRATDDINVDIDLGKEGRANKISRRQAIIKMEEDGSFCLKNLGKCSILVNSKEVATGQCLGLSSSCLIEIRGMRFMFETNQSFVRQYLASTARKKSQDESTKFEWSAEEVQ